MARPFMTGYGRVPLVAAMLVAGCAPATPRCPTSAPSANAACSEVGQSCTYQSCSSFGVATATCQSSGWQITMSPCAEVPCMTNFGASSCPAGQLCVTRQGGARTTMCEANPCGDGPVDCTCVCNGSCVSGSGLTWTCNTCPGGGCP